VGDMQILPVSQFGDKDSKGNTKFMVFWDVVPHHFVDSTYISDEIAASIFSVEYYPEDISSRFLRNIGTKLHDVTFQKTKGYKV
jgi:hypothetical protein